MRGTAFINPKEIDSRVPRASAGDRRLTQTGRGVYSARHDDDRPPRIGAAPPPQSHGTGARSRV